VLLITSIIGWCSLYALLGISTINKEAKWIFNSKMSL
jgi:hypothetical protein